jgi:hypothetical protein
MIHPSNTTKAPKPGNTRSNSTSRKGGAALCAFTCLAATASLAPVGAQAASARLTVVPTGAEVTPAARLTGVHLVKSKVSARNSNAVKQQVAFCPAGQRVIGGGGWVHEFGSSHNPALTELRPFHFYRKGNRDAYRATAAETTRGTRNSWTVQAYAICADAGSLAHWQIYSADSALSSSPAHATAKACPRGQRVLGTGASIENQFTHDPNGQVVLQVARSSQTGDIVRAQAHEDVDGYPYRWRVKGYAICATPPRGYVIPTFGRSPASHSETVKVAVSRCPAGKVLLSSGAAVSNVAPANVSLQGIYPSVAGRQTQAIAVENTPTSANWDFMVANAVCAS